MYTPKSLVRQMLATLNKRNEALNKHNTVRAKIINSAKNYKKNFNKSLIDELMRIETRIAYLESHLANLGKRFSRNYPAYANHNLKTLERMFS